MSLNGCGLVVSTKLQYRVRALRLGGGGVLLPFHNFAGTSGFAVFTQNFDAQIWAIGTQQWKCRSKWHNITKTSIDTAAVCLHLPHIWTCRRSQGKSLWRRWWWTRPRPSFSSWSSASPACFSRCSEIILSTLWMKTTCLKDKTSPLEM